MSDVDDNEGRRESEVDSVVCRACRKDVMRLKLRWGCACVLERSDGDAACGGIETPAIEVNASRTEARHDVHRAIERCILCKAAARVAM